MIDVESRDVLRAALDEWEALNRLREFVRQIFPEDECNSIEGTLKAGAAASLKCLEDEESNDEVETQLRDRLKQLAASE